MAQSARFLSPKPVSFCNIPHPSLDKTFRVRVPFHPRGKHQDPPLKTSPQGSCRCRIVSILPFLGVVVTTSKLALPLVNTLPENTKNGRRVIAYPLVENPREISQIPTWVKFIFFFLGWLACSFSYWHVYSEKWRCNFPHWNVFLSYLARISFPAAYSPWMIRTSGFAGEVDICDI